MSADARASPGSSDEPPEDVFLEDLRGERSMSWVESENARALASVVGPEKLVEDDPIYARLRSIYDDKNKIPSVRLRGSFVYNFWQDETHVKGIWRRTTMDDFKTSAPTWETVLDVDALAAEESVSWVWKGPVFLDYGPGQETRKDRCVVKLSDGGTDACAIREFDVVRKAFVPESEHPFNVPPGKNNFAWVNRDLCWIGHDRGPGTMSPSGYPLTTVEWRRGTPLSEAKEIWRGEPEDVVAAGSAYWDKGHRYKIWYRAVTFYDTRHHAENARGERVEVDIPSDFSLNTFADHVVIHCKSDWDLSRRGDDEEEAGEGGGGFFFKSGTVVAHPAASFLDGAREDFTVLYEPANERCAYGGSSDTRDYLLVHALEDLRTKVLVWRFDASAPEGAPKFSLAKEYVAEGCRSFGASGVDANASNDVFVTADGFLDPASLSLATAPDVEVTGEPLKKNTEWFDATGMDATLREAVSDDGTKVPYFLVRPRVDNKQPGPGPCVLYGYGGFEIPMLPGYSASVGEAFLSRGVSYAVACIRGGGEFGPEWHRAAKKAKRWRAYEDFAAVAKDLVASGVTTHERLGCVGGSNGGLLTGAMVTHYPHLFGAAVSQCPLLDMERYVLLTSGPSWIDEYGDPGVPEEREALLGFSPYHNVKRGVERAVEERGMTREDAERGEWVPATLFTTSTADDRVHPSHARRFVHKMRRLGIGENVLYHEMTEGGHAGAADNAARAKVKTIEYRFLVDALERGERKIREATNAGRGGE
jgi:prolyl oligopeptidase